MRFVNWLCRFIVFAGMIGVGATAALYTKEQASELFITQYDVFKDMIGIPEGFMFRYVIAGIGGVIALGLGWTLLPAGRREREITFSGTHGEVSIALEPVEATLNRVVQKLPDVKTIELKIKPMEGLGKVRIVGTAILFKDAESDARMVTARVLNFITIHARKILGVSDIEPKIKVRRWVMKMKTVKPEPLLLSGPGGEDYQEEPQPQRVQARKPSQESVAAARAEEGVAEAKWDNPDDLVIEGNER